MTDETRFLQIHTLTTYAAALLNRDDIGLAKRLPFGGVERIRVSSQCLKRHWRRSADAWSLQALGEPMAVRSRQIFADKIAEPLRKEGFEPRSIVAVLAALQTRLLGESAKAERARKNQVDEAEAADPDKRFESLHTEQVIVLGEPEITFVTEAARRLLADAGDAKDAAKAADAYLKENRANLDALRRACGLDAALFGRMVTSDILARGDAAVHVAHAFTVHAAEAEPDYFTAVDDLVALGSGHINQSELTSGLFYGYVVVDLPLLVANLSGDAVLAGRVVEHLAHTVAKVSPGAKLGSTAPYGYAEVVLAEAGARQPRSLANAFLKPVPRNGDLGAAAVGALARHLGAFDRMYGAEEQRRVVALGDIGAIPAEPAESFAALAGWAAAAGRAS